MSIDTVSSNNPLSQLNQVSKKRELSNFISPDTAEDENVSPAYIVELSERGKQLQRANPAKIVHL